MYSARDLFIRLASDIFEVLAPEAAVRRRNSLGGTGFEQVQIQIDLAKTFFA